MEPGGGMILLPFIRYVTIALMIGTGTAFINGFVRIHMGILFFLSSGLYLSLIFFEQQYNKVTKNSHQAPPITTTTKSGSNGVPEKTD